VLSTFLTVRLGIQVTCCCVLPARSIIVHDHTSGERSELRQFGGLQRSSALSFSLAACRRRLGE
jgi:hypothetical protein